ncbi:MAG: DUF559 domain-containing protein [Parvularculaceae bacterium]|nr:DUF559 domain-containing protein [Parvularculaceae bacterium]
MTANRLTPTARRLRQTSNFPENAAWQTLRKLRAEGYPVKRQAPIGPYVVDFAIERARLIIEVDGGVHRMESVKSNDELREQDLRQLGWDVMRVDARAAISVDYLLTAVRRRIGI